MEMGCEHCPLMWGTTERVCLLNITEPDCFVNLDEECFLSLAMLGIDLRFLGLVLLITHIPIFTTDSAFLLDCGKNGDDVTC